MTTAALPAVSRGHVDDADGWTVFVPEPGSVLAGEPSCRVKVLRTEGARTRMHRASLLSLQPSTFRWQFQGDESWIVLRGRLTITLDDTGEAIEMGPGDAISVAAGRGSVWVVHEPFLKFVVTTQA